MNGFTYDNPLILSYHFAAANFGGDANVTRLIAVPVLKNGRKPAGKIIGALLSNISEDFTGDVTDARLEVGISGDTDKYFESITLDETVDVGETLWLNNNAAANAAVDIEAGRTDFTVTFVAGTTTETGIADVTLYVGWY